MSNPFHNPAQAAGIEWEHQLGKLLLIEPSALETGISTVHGIKDAIRADVTVIDADGAPEEYKDALIFPGVLISQTRSLIGEKVLGRLSQGQAKTGQKPPWKLLDATDDDVSTGVAYLKTRESANPFAAAAPAEAKAPF